MSFEEPLLIDSLRFKQVAKMSNNEGINTINIERHNKLQIRGHKMQEKEQQNIEQQEHQHQ